MPVREQNVPAMVRLLARRGFSVRQVAGGRMTMHDRGPRLTVVFWDEERGKLLAEVILDQETGRDLVFVRPA